MRLNAAYALHGGGPRDARSPAWAVPLLRWGTNLAR